MSKEQGIEIVGPESSGLYLVKGDLHFCFLVNDIQNAENSYLTSDNAAFSFRRENYFQSEDAIFTMHIGSGFQDFSDEQQRAALRIAYDCISTDDDIIFSITGLKKESISKINKMWSSFV